MATHHHASAPATPAVRHPTCACCAMVSRPRLQLMSRPGTSSPSAASLSPHARWYACIASPNSLPPCSPCPASQHSAACCGAGEGGSSGVVHQTTLAATGGRLPGGRCLAAQPTAAAITELAASACAPTHLHQRVCQVGPRQRILLPLQGGAVRLARLPQQLRRLGGAGASCHLSPRAGAMQGGGTGGGLVGGQPVTLRV